VTPLQTFFVLFLAQVISYILLDKYNLSKWKSLIFSLLITGYIFIIPSQFIPDNHNIKPMCGMPIIGISFAIGFLGCGTTIITHFVYLAINIILFRPKVYGT
jgi:hypothetical protein